MTKESIRALGNLLGYYHSDLVYIRNFHRYKNGKINTKDYLQKDIGTFRTFINEFKIARNIDKTETNKLLQLSIKWVKTKKCNQVDEFAQHLKDQGITHGKIMTSLASKILFLNDPYNILPIDNLAKNAVKQKKSNKYLDYQPLVLAFANKNSILIKESLSSIESLLKEIEKEFKNEIPDVKTIRYNRYLDKLLWTLGQKK